MNEQNYRMDYEERRNYVYDAALEALQDDDNFINACDALDSYDGFMGDARCYPMSELDDLLGETKPSKILSQATQDFDINDDYFYFSIHGLESTDDTADVYRSEHTEEEVLDALIDNPCIDIYGADSLVELVKILWNEDFGIEEGWEYDEDNYDGEEYLDEPEETDEEFKNRINSI